MMYALCATARCGSTYLQGLLQSTRIAGYPEEVVATPIIRRLTGLPRGSYGPEVLDAMKPWFSTQNGVFGVQLMAPKNIDRKYDYFLHMSRRDRLAQAVSMVTLMQTKYPYASAETREKIKLSVSYNRDLITESVEAVERKEASWSRYFADKPVLEVVYEDVLADPQTEINRVLSYLGLDPATARPVRELSLKQGDRTNQEWIDRYKAGE